MEEIRTLGRINSEGRGMSASTTEYDMNSKQIIVGAAAAAVNELLASKPRPTALYTASIKLTIGALRAVREAGIQVPSEMEIVG